jgi:hypothetical protein
MELEDARLLFAFAKTQIHDRELAALAVAIAGDLAGQDFGRISQSCGWERSCSRSFTSCWPSCG